MVQLNEWPSYVFLKEAADGSLRELLLKHHLLFQCQGKNSEEVTELLHTEYPQLR